jgi:hypothetical protein
MSIVLSFDFFKGDYGSAALAEFDSLRLFFKVIIALHD